MSDRLDRVRKLLAYAESTTGEDAEAYTERAMRLMAEHGIDEAMVTAAQVRAGERVAPTPVTRKVAMDDPYSRGKADLLVTVGSRMGCGTVYHWRGNRRKIQAVSLVGFPGDVERVELLYTSLLLQVAKAVATLRPDPLDTARGPGRNETASYRRAFLAGFTDRVADRVWAAEQQARERAEAQSAATPGPAGVGGPSVALVLADRDALVRSMVDELATTKRTIGRSRVSDTDGFYDGVAAGERADIGSRAGKLGPTDRPALPG